MIEKLLIANRGEIALRVIRAAKTLGVETVGIYSEQDRHSSHVKMADESYSLGGGPTSQNYLNIQKILDIAYEVGADSVHPGYGFLAESPEFAEAVSSAGLKWVGPSPEVIRKLGDKLTSREIAEKVGVPVSPGSDEPVLPNEDAKKIAREIGYPIMIKASFGGGGMGIQVVRSEEELLPTLERTAKQAKAAFGNAEVFMEKFIEKPRHIEIQFIGDRHGKIVHLGERECSIQRRHQKLIEEAPSTAISEEERERIGNLVKKLAKYVGYENAGTAEFLYKDGQFYFNEVNTRIQVEHPVTEMITGKDLVLEQLLVASGKRLSWSQKDISFFGHAIEMRINAEDPLMNFAPTSGKILQLSIPGGPGVRFDSHIFAGYTIPKEYDSLLGKLVVWGEDRNQSTARAFFAMTELAITGVPTNLPFHRVAIANKNFQRGNLHTGFIEENNILPYIRTAYNRRVVALFATQMKTRKVFLPIREQSNWRQTALKELTRGI